MSKRASQAALNELHAALARILKDKIESPEVDAATLQAARAFLRDNHIDVDPARPSEPVESLTEAFNALDEDGEATPKPPRFN